MKKRNGRKEVTRSSFKGVAVDGGFVFEACVFHSYLGTNRKETEFKVTSYSDGVMEIYIDYTENISRVAELISGMFSSESNFTNLDYAILNYHNIRLKIVRDTGRKNIICMLMKEMSKSEYKNGNNEVSVDTQICQKLNPLRNSDKSKMWNEAYTNSFRLVEIAGWSKDLWFVDSLTRESLIITSLKDGIITIDCMAGDTILDFVKILKSVFVPYSNLYGIKAIEVAFNEFSIKVDDHNVDSILYLYKRSCDLSQGLYEKELQEYYNSPEYIRNHAKFLKKNNRKKAVVQKVRQFQKRNADFTIINDKKKHEEWENCKAINSQNDYSKCVIDYVILWAQYMEYLMAKHDKKLSDIWDISSHSADIYGITGFMYGCAICILSSFWKYGEELRRAHNSKYHHEVYGVVNPAVLTISA